MNIGSLNTSSKNKNLENTNANIENSNVGNNGVKMKAYLAVVVSNVKELENSYKRVTLLASSIGSTKVGGNACSSQFFTFGSILLLLTIALKQFFNHYFLISTIKINL